MTRDSKRRNRRSDKKSNPAWSNQGISERKLRPGSPTYSPQFLVLASGLLCGHWLLLPCFGLRWSFASNARGNQSSDGCTTSSSSLPEFPDFSSSSGLGYAAAHTSQSGHGLKMYLPAGLQISGMHTFECPDFGFPTVTKKAALAAESSSYMNVASVSAC